MLIRLCILMMIRVSALTIGEQSALIGSVATNIVNSSLDNREECSLVDLIRIHIGVPTKQNQIVLGS